MNNEELYNDAQKINSMEDNAEIISETEETTSMMNEDEELIAKYEMQIKENEEKLEDENLSMMEKEMIRSKIRSLNLNITAMKMKNENN
ncbi:MAG: hypothetical protein MJ245_01140 [Clostridia bacterium]|nr:hypothetical protein [Clostridia bacterium]